MEPYPFGVCVITPMGKGGSPSYESQIPGAPHKGGYFLDPLFGGEAVPSSGQPQGKRGEAAQSGGLLAVSLEAADQSRKGSGRGPRRGVGGGGLGGRYFPSWGLSSSSRASGPFHCTRPGSAQECPGRTTHSPFLVPSPTSSPFSLISPFSDNLVPFLAKCWILWTKAICGCSWWVYWDCGKWGIDSSQIWLRYSPPGDLGGKHQACP